MTLLLLFRLAVDFPPTNNVNMLTLLYLLCCCASVPSTLCLCLFSVNFQIRAAFLSFMCSRLSLLSCFACLSIVGSNISLDTIWRYPQLPRGGKWSTESSVIAGREFLARNAFRFDVTVGLLLTVSFCSTAVSETRREIVRTTSMLAALGICSVSICPMFTYAYS